MEQRASSEHAWQAKLEAARAEHQESVQVCKVTRDALQVLKARTTHSHRASCIFLGHATPLPLARLSWWACFSPPVMAAGGHM